MSRDGTARSRLNVLMVLPVVLLLVLAMQGAVPNHYRNIRINNVGSLNWAGYASATDFASPQPSVNMVNASWVVQSASKTSTSTYSSQWLGIGGYFLNDNSLIQTGTESDYYSSSSHYSAWWELIPASATTISGFSVSPGDIMSASIKLLNKTGSTWLITIKDITKNEVFTKTVTYSPSMLSAEYVEERPELCNIFGCSLATLANFGTAYYGYDYSGISGTEFAAYSSNAVALGSMPNQAITMYSSSGSAIATPSSLTPDGTSFSVAYSTGTGTTTTTTSTVSTTSTIPAGYALLNISVTATDSKDSYLRDWNLFVDKYPYLNTSTYSQNFYSGGTLSYQAVYPEGNHIIYFYIGQSGGSAYGTYSGTMHINSYSTALSGVDSTHALMVLYNTTLGIMQSSVISFVPSTTTTTTLTSSTTSTIPTTVTSSTTSTSTSTTRSTTVRTTRTTTRTTTVSTTTTIRRHGG